MSNRRLVLLSLLGLAVALVLLGGTPGSDRIDRAGPGGGASASTVEPAPQHAVDDRGRMYDECIVLDDDTQSPWRECVYGDPRSDTHVVLLGDSQALHWGPGMIQLAEARGWRLTALMRQGCTVAQVRFEQLCDSWRRNIMRRIARRERPDLIVVSTGTTRRFEVLRGSRRLNPIASLPFMRRGMILTLRRLVATGARVALIRDQHRAVPRPPDCLLENPDSHPNRACWFSPTRRLEIYNWDYRAARSTQGVRVVDPNPLLCPGGDRCPVVRDGNLMYRDTYHMTATFSRTLAPWLARQLPRPVKWR